MAPEQTCFLQKLYNEHHNAMFYVAKRIIRDSVAASDIVSQAFLMLILKIDVVMEYDEPEKWLFHVLKNIAIDEYRRTRLHGLVSIEDIPEMSVEPEFISFSDLLPKGLTSEEKKILTLRIDRDMDYREISELMSISCSACRMKYSRAKKHCAELMEKQDI